MDLTDATDLHGFQSLSVIILLGQVQAFSVAVTWTVSGAKSPLR